MRVDSRLMVKTQGWVSGGRTGNMVAGHRHPIQAVRRPLLALGTLAEGRRVQNPALDQNSPMYLFTVL